MMSIQTQGEALKKYLEAVKELRKEQILTNQKEFTSQVGEWLVEQIYNGKRAVSGIQRGWDVESNGNYIQVKSHAKADGNSNRWSALEDDTTEKIDELIIIVFSPDYKLKEFYKIPWQIAKEKIVLQGEKTKRKVVRWGDLADYKQNMESLPNQEFIKLFI